MAENTLTDDERNAIDVAMWYAHWNGRGVSVVLAAVEGILTARMAGCQGGCILTAHAATEEVEHG